MKYIQVNDRVVDLETGQIAQGDDTEQLPPRLLSLLNVFINQGDRVLSRDELIEAVWGHLDAATDDSVNVAVSSLRRAIGDDRRPHRVIKAVPRRGYLFDSTRLKPLDPDQAAALMAAGRQSSETSATHSKAPAGAGISRASAIAAGLAAAVVIVVAGLVLAGRTSPEDESPSTSGEPIEVAQSSRDSSQSLPEKSIAVLPFSDLSPDGESQWFADGLSEEILNSLVRVPDLLVAARNSSVAYRGSTLPVSEIGSALGVKHVLEGSVRMDAGRVRVTARLTRSPDGVHVWSNNFDRETADMIDIQEELARQISMALETRMDPEALAAMASAGTRSVEAYRSYIQGRAFGTTSTPEAYAFFEQARELDSGFAAAHYNAALYWQFQGNPTVLSRTKLDVGVEETRRRFAERIEAAIETASDPVAATLYRALEAREQLRLSEAVALFRRYVDERPSDFSAWLQTLELAYMVGDEALHERALAVFRERSLSDRVVAIHYLVHAYRAKAVEDWIDHAYLLATRWPDAIFVQYQIHRALLWAGRVEEAREFHDRVLLMDIPPRGALLLQVRQACAEERVNDAVALFEGQAKGPHEWFFMDTLSRTDEANAVLRKTAIENGIHGLVNFLLYPQFDARRFPSLVRLLEREGIDIREPTPIPFACSPDRAAVST